MNSENTGTRSNLISQGNWSADVIDKRKLVSIASFLVGVAVLVTFIYLVGLQQIAQVILQVNPSLIVAMVAIQLLGFVFYATAWYFLIRATGGRIRFLTCQGIAFASIFLSYVLPSGVFMEAARCVLGAKESGMKLGESTATVIFHRLLYFVGFLLSTGLALAALVTKGGVTSRMLFDLALLPALAITGLLIVLYISFHPKIMNPILERVLRAVQPVIELVQKEAQMNGKAERLTNDYQAGFRKMLASKAHLVASLLASLGDWTCAVLILWVVLVALGSVVSIWIVILTMAIGKMIQMTPIAIPGMIGVYETAVTTSLALFGLPVAVAASAALLARIVTAWLDLPITGLAAYHYGFKFIWNRTSTAS